MSKADHGLITYSTVTPSHRAAPVMGLPAEAMSPKLSRRSLIGGAAVAALAALPPLEALAALPSGVSKHASKESLGELAEVRRLIDALVRIEDRISAAENADDAHRAEKLEGKHRRVYRKLRKLQTAIESRPPRCGVDLVTRAELVGYEYLHGKPRADWNQLVSRRALAQHAPSLQRGSGCLCRLAGCREPRRSLGGPDRPPDRGRQQPPPGVALGHARGTPGAGHDQPQTICCALSFALARTIGATTWVPEIKGLKTQTYRDTRGPGLAPGHCCEPRQRSHRPRLRATSPSSG